MDAKRHEDILSKIDRTLADHEAAMAGTAYDELHRRVEENGGIDDDEVTRQLRKIGGKIVGNWAGEYARKIESDLL